MDIVQTFAELERNEELHLARLLILLNAFSRNHGTIEGLTKLAKLDFLLRYPTYLEKALQLKQKKAEKVEVADHERYSIESRMIRFRYGPWDHRYRRLLNILVGRGLAQISVEGRTVHIGLTDVGKNLAEQLVQSEEFKTMQIRAGLLKINFDIKGTNLMKFIYEAFPEIVSLKFNQEIGKDA